MSDIIETFEFVKKMVKEQSEDEGLWFEAQTAPEAYLQQELRRLHHLVETGQIII
ncbi:MAG: hypothetical protein GY928_31930 [Colwellia sp.]|nr:hypothetical protein [Colwellia sp.]